MFDRVAVVDLSHSGCIYPWLPVFKRLTQEGLVYEPNKEVLTLGLSDWPDVWDLLEEWWAVSSEKERYEQETNRLLNRAISSEEHMTIRDQRHIEWDRLNKDCENRYRMGWNCLVRMGAVALRESGSHACPVLEDMRVLSVVEQRAKSVEVANIVLEAFPLPSPKCSWEQLLEFRLNPEVRELFNGLRVWISGIARSDLSRMEITQKLEWLIQEQRRHLRIARMEADSTLLEILVVTTAEILESIVKLNLGHAAKLLFSLRKRRLALMKAELNVPGRELAYLVKARERFSDTAIT